jgi:hypothetical protein
MRQNHPIKENSEPLIGYSAGDSSNRDNNLKKNRASPSSTQASRDRYNSASNSPLGLCSEHFRPLEIYCLEPECIDLVCANCALFGKHKGHKVKEQSELDKETKEMVDDLESVHRDLKAAEAEILAKESVNAWANRLKSELIAKEEDIHRFFDVGGANFRMLSRG